MEFEKNIVFVGDSFCSAWSGTSGIPHRVQQQQSNGNDAARNSWLDEAASALELNLYSFGFSGRSWYYSRTQLFGQMQYDPEWINSVDLMIFCHTNSTRYNTCNGNIGVEMADVDFRPHSDDAEYAHKLNLANSLRAWLADLMDTNHQDWAQEQWFHEIARTFQNIKQIHFNNFTHTVDKASALLPGVVFTTPLIHISLGEATGTDAEVTKNFMSIDQRVNHLNSHNNRALANLVVATAQNYQPGIYPIDVSVFDYINPNASRWPNPGFGSR